MYRKSLTEKMASENEVQDPHFVERVSNLPIVTAALDQLVAIYEQAKSSNKIVKYTLETGETVVKTATSTAKPVIENLPLEKPIAALDSLACTQLDKLEEKYPLINKPTDDWKEGTKEMYDAKVKPAVDRVVQVKDTVVSAKDTGLNTVVAAKDTGVSTLVAAKDYGVGTATAAKDYGVSTATAAKDYGVSTATAAKDYGVGTATAAKDYSVSKISDAKQYTVEKVEEVKTYSKETVQGAVQYTTEKISSALATPTGQVVVGNVDAVLAKTEGLVDNYLPSDEEKDENEEEMEVEGVETVGTVQRITSINSKMQRRIMGRALKQLHNVQLRSKESLQKLSFTVDLISYAKENIDGKVSATRDKMTSIWEEINRPEEETAAMKEAEAATSEGEEVQQCSNATFERRAIATARHLTLQMKHGFATVYSTISVLPTSLKTKVTDAKAYSEQLHSSFANAGSLSEISSSVLTQTKERVVHLQETMTYFADYLKNTYFSNWLGQSSSSANATTEDMEMEEIQREADPQMEQPEDVAMSDDKLSESACEKTDNI